jgi:hypothetical protein
MAPPWRCRLTCFGSEAAQFRLGGFFYKRELSRLVLEEPVFVMSRMVIVVLPKTPFVESTASAKGKQCRSR